MGLEKSEYLRQLMEMALASGRKKQSKQSGFIHHYYGIAEDTESPLPIPVVENFLFALSLLRSRIAENVLEAKDLLNKLLYFQNRSIEENKGNFPLYLHEFPFCKDRFAAAHVSLVLFWILKNYPQGLGSELKNRLEIALHDAVVFSLRDLQSKGAPFHLTLKIAACLKGAGSLLGSPEMSQEGDRLLEQVIHTPEKKTWFSPSSLGITLSALSAIFPTLNPTSWDHLLDYLSKTWHFEIGAYVGPPLRVWQAGFEPQVTLYDLFMGYFAQKMPDRFRHASLTLLEATLIPQSETFLKEVSLPCEFEETEESEKMKWTLYKDEALALCAIEKEMVPGQIQQERGLHLLRLLWGTSQRCHSFVLQGGNIKKLTLLPIEKGPLCFKAILDLNPVWGEEGGREKSREIACFLDVQEALSLNLNGLKASTFTLGESLSWISCGKTFTLTFTRLEGEGSLFGHLIPGNRPSQIDGGVRLYEMYDWQIFLRVVNRSDSYKILMTLSVEE